ncbi:MAG TPA: hypothetical protein VNO53_09645 [Steroidobacteraceae bacterium]|nr:hypothetical protein [Steroidobacteraceae bacterium]
MDSKILGSLAAALPLLVPAAAPADEAHQHVAADTAWHAGSPLVQKVRKATAKYRDINFAMSEGYAPGTPCVSGPNSGAMGVHFINGALLGKEIDAEAPEALIYEPLPNGKMRLVGVEIITFASDWVGEVPVLDGHLLHYVGEPNRYGIPAFYEIHVWAWRDNPDGAFADWNPRVTCAGQPLPTG